MAETPATKDLFVVSDDAAKLDSSKKEHYHTLTAKLLYLSKRVRPDILTAISFLARRVQSPDVDYEKNYTGWYDISAVVERWDYDYQPSQSAYSHMWMRPMESIQT